MISNDFPAGLCGNGVNANAEDRQGKRTMHGGGY